MAQISKGERAQSATVRSNGKLRYPINSYESARAAVRLMGKANPPLSQSEKDAILQAAASYGHYPHR